MIINKLKIQNIPAVLWGEKSSKIILAAHGSQSSKTDDCIRILAEEAVPMGFQVLSFDFPKHGDRVNEDTLCMVWECERELKCMLSYARQNAEQIYVFGCSMGAWFSLLAYKDEIIEHALFLSPVTDMDRIIHNIMRQFDITEERLKSEKIVENPLETLYWDYYCYVREHPVEDWGHPTSILYGEHDLMCEHKYVKAFADRWKCSMEIQPGGEHWFHTPEQLLYYRNWVRRKLKEIRSMEQV